MAKDKQLEQQPDNRMEFENSENSNAANGSLWITIAICFGLSTVSSTICIWAAGVGFASAEKTDWLSVFMGLVALGICYIVDFFGVKRAGKLFFTELIGLISPEFKRFTPLRIIAMGLWGLVVFAFFGVSFVTSNYGADIVKAAFRPKQNTQAIAAVSANREAAEQKAFAPYEQRRKEAKQERDNALANIGTPQMRKLAKKGDEVASNNIKMLAVP